MKKLFILLFVLLISVSVYAKDILVKDNSKNVVAKLRLSKGITYNIYDTKNVKIGTYKASQKLTKTYMKGKKFKLIQLADGKYTIKE